MAPIIGLAAMTLMRSSETYVSMVHEPAVERDVGKLRSSMAQFCTSPLHVLPTSLVTRSCGRPVEGDGKKSKPLFVTDATPFASDEKVGAMEYCEGFGRTPALKSSASTPATVSTR